MSLFNALLVVPLVLLRPAAASSVTVSASPSNDTIALTQQYGSLRWLLTDSQNAFSTQIGLAPLTQPLATLDDQDFQNSRLVGSLVDITSSNTASISSQDICLISCDPSDYPGYLDAAETVSDVVSQSNGTPVAVVLYSTQSDFCNYTASDFNFSNVFTVLEASSAQAVLDHLGNATSTSTNTTSSKRSSASAAPTVTLAANMSSSVPFGGGNYSSSSDSSSGDTSSSTTAVAMIILYTITGIITALFLGIIVTGAVRAHRHPERYGPRNITGRPRQSRARGIARAMLETIPIVKFGDSPDVSLDAAKRDLEMASRNEEDASIEAHTTTHADPTADTRETNMTGGADAEDEVEGEARHQTGTEHAVESQQTETDADAPGIGADVAAATAPHSKDASDMGNNVCPICTDEFVKGQDVRLLPCSHQFHPDCIDPWLINVSGTCPLCRINLNPDAGKPEAGQEGEQHEGNENDPDHEHADAEAGEAEAAAGISDMASPQMHSTRTSGHRGLAGYLSDMREVRRARNAPVEERLEALRRLRQLNINSTTTSSPDLDDSQGHRRRHLSTRLRDRFRIRTRQHGASSAEESPQPPSSPAPPSPPL